MKAKLLFILCLLLGFGLTNLSGQKPTVKYYFEGEMSEPVMCDGQEFNLTGIEYGKEVDIYYANGDLKMGTNQIRGTLTNESTGEVFNIHIKYKGDWIDGFVIEQYNFKGNMGSHYNARLVWDVVAGWEYYWTKTNCH